MLPPAPAIRNTLPFTGSVSTSSFAQSGLFGNGICFAVRICWASRTATDNPSAAAHIRSLFTDDPLILRRDRLVVCRRDRQLEQGPALGLVEPLTPAVGRSDP